MVEIHRLPVGQGQRADVFQLAQGGVALRHKGIKFRILQPGGHRPHGGAVSARTGVGQRQQNGVVGAVALGAKLRCQRLQLRKLVQRGVVLGGAGGQRCPKKQNKAKPQHHQKLRHTVVFCVRSHAPPCKGGAAKSPFAVFCAPNCYQIVSISIP